MFLGVSILAGLLVAAMLVPLVGGAGLSARSTAQTFAEPRSALNLRPLAQRSRILAADGKTVIADLYDENRTSIPLTSVAPVMRQAILAIEDSRFYEHGGVDPRGTARAVATNLFSGGVVQGGSTLTQQYVKNVLVEQAGSDEKLLEAARGEDIARKLRELQYAIQVEKELTKDQILENYLNISYFGAGAYGIEAAARHYFSKSASKLNLAEAAMLAGVVRSPAYYAPTTALRQKRAVARRNTVLDRMAEVKMITPAQAAQAKATGLNLKVSKPRHGCANAKEAAWFCSYVSEIIKNDPIFGKTRQERTALLERGGLDIVTTLDLKTQRAAQKAVSRRVYAKDRFAGAVSIVQPGTGEIKAMAQSVPYGTRGGLNLNVDKKYGGGIGFQPGSTFKAFVTAAALGQRISPNTSFFAPYELDAGDMEFRTCEGRTKAPGWKPNNETESETGTYDMARALRMSINNYFVQLEQRTGVCEPAKLAAAMGVRTGSGEAPDQVAAFTLGVESVAPLTMAEAYATFAARGTHCSAIAIKSITNRDGRKLAVPAAKCSGVMKPQIADATTSLLRGVIDSPDGTGRRADIGRPAAGKTGTHEREQVWFVGYTPNMAAAVWVGSPHGSGKRMVDVTIGGEHYNTVQGANIPAPIWREAMQAAVDGLPAEDFQRPSGEFALPGGAQVPDVRGIGVNEAMGALQAAGFQPRVDGRQVRSGRPPGTVAFTDPRAGSRVPPGTSVTVFISRGGGGSNNQGSAGQNNGNRPGNGNNANFPQPQCQNGGTWPFCRP
jgi:membrane peptidoglycan carboxypeptidase